MDGMLSQDEINALLSGMDAPSDSGSAAAEEADIPAAAPDSPAAVYDGTLLTDMEKDAIGEVANISMGSSATTLYSLVNRKVNITTPVVTLAKWENVLSDYEKPCVFIQIKYTVMNQMMGSSATSMSTMLGKMIDISPPEASLVDLTAFKSGGEIAPFLADTFVKVAFRMQIDELVDSTIMQLYPMDFAKELCDTFLASQLGEMEPEPAPAPQAAAPAPTPQPTAPPPAAAPQMAPQMDMNQMNMGMGMGMGMPQMMPQMQMPMMQTPVQPNMNIQPAQFQNFSGDFNPAQIQENIGLIKDVPLEVTVELGRTSKSISDILDFSPGTIIELDKIAGEPIDVLVNGKFVAKGEVVVIEESFGVRVTEIIK